MVNVIVHNYLHVDLLHINVVLRNEQIRKRIDFEAN